MTGCKATPGLTEAQRCCLEWAQYSELGDAHYCEVDDATRAATLHALQRKGYVANVGGYRYWLTEKGDRARAALLKARGEISATIAEREKD